MPHDPPQVSEPMTWGQICARFPNQWIALVALDWVDDQGELYRIALIAGHGTRREALAQARPLRKLFPSLGPYFTADASSARLQLPIIYVT